MLCKNEITKKITENYSLSSKKGCKTFRSKDLSKGKFKKVIFFVIICEV